MRKWFWSIWAYLGEEHEGRKNVPDGYLPWTLWVIPYLYISKSLILYSVTCKSQWKTLLWSALMSFFFSVQWRLDMYILQRSKQTRSRIWLWQLATQQERENSTRPESCGPKGMSQICRNQFLRKKVLSDVTCPSLFLTIFLLWLQQINYSNRFNKAAND